MIHYLVRTNTGRRKIRESSADHFLQLTLVLPLLQLSTPNGHFSIASVLRFRLTEHLSQAAQATFKSIKALMPLLDRVLVQRFKPETVCAFFFLCFFEAEKSAAR